MAYIDVNFKTKKALKEAVARGDELHILPSMFGPSPNNGRVAVEGPHFPDAHTFYAIVEIFDGKVRKVIG